MKKYIFILCLFCICPSSFADELSESVHWKYPDCNFMTVQKIAGDTSKDPEMILAKWSCSEEKPSQEALKTIKQEYKDYLKSEKDSRKAKKSALALKLGLSSSEVKDLAALVQDGNLE